MNFGNLKALHLHSTQWPVARAARDGLASIVGRENDDGVVQHARGFERVVDSVHNLKSKILY